MQFFYVNGRLVRDKLIAHAVRQAFQDVLFHGRHPVFVLYLTLDPALVDVNAHPAKLEVRFREGRLVHDFLFSALHRAIAQVRPGQIITQSTTDIDAFEDGANLPKSSMFKSLTSATGYQPKQSGVPFQLEENLQAYGKLYSAPLAPPEIETPVEEGIPPLGYAVAHLHKYLHCFGNPKRHHSGRCPRRA